MTTKPRPTECLIVNGKYAGDEGLRKFVDARRAAGFDLEVRVTFESGDGRCFAFDAVERGISSLIAAGGDGTFSEVIGGADAGARAAAHAMMPTVGLLPVGTANDFAIAAGIPIDLAEAVAALDRYQPVAVDIGRCNDASFINMLTGGYGSEITAQTSEAVKGALGPVAYMLTGLSRFAELEPIEGSIDVDGKIWQGRFLALGVGNGRLAGGGHALCPDARIDDGLLDVAILPAPADGSIAGTVAQLMARGEAAVQNEFVRLQGRKVRFEAAEPRHFNLDGEPLKSARLDVSVDRAAVCILLPDDSALLSARA